MSRTGSRPGDPEVGPRRFRGRGRSGLTLKDPGVSQGRAPKVLRRTGRGGLGCEQAYWIPYSSTLHGALCKKLIRVQNLAD